MSHAYFDGHVGNSRSLGRSGWIEITDFKIMNIYYSKGGGTLENKEGLLIVSFKKVFDMLTQKLITNWTSGEKFKSVSLEGDLSTEWGSGTINKKNWGYYLRDVAVLDWRGANKEALPAEIVTIEAKTWREMAHVRSHGYEAGESTSGVTPRGRNNRY